MAIACQTCAHPQLREINAACLAPGANVAGISRRYGLGWDGRALRRHVETHVGENLREASQAVEQTHAAELLGRLVELADASADIRRDALEHHRTRTAVAAVTAEARVLDQLMTKLGITDARIVAELKHGRDLARLVGAAVQRNPQIADALADEAARRGDDDTAQGLRAMAAQGKASAALTAPPRPNLETTT